MKLGDLFVQVSAKGVGQVNQGLDQTEKKATLAAKATNLLKTAIMAIGTYAVINAIKNVIQTFVDYTVQIDKFTKQTGMATDTIQKLVYAAEQEHSDLESLNKGLMNLTVRLGYAGDGLETYLRYFRTLGIEYQNADGTLRDTYDVFLDIADVASKGALSTEDLAAITQLFGARAGKELIPLLKKGRDWFELMGDEAERLGIVLDDLTVKRGKEFSDLMTEVSKEVMGLKLAIADDLIPTLKDMLGLVKGLSENYRLLKEAWEWMFYTKEEKRLLSISDKEYMEFFGLLPEVIVTAGKETKKYGETAEEAQERLAAAIEAAKKKREEMRKALEDLQPVLALDIDYTDERVKKQKELNDALQNAIDLYYGALPGIENVKLAEEGATETSTESAEILNTLGNAFNSLNLRLMGNAEAFQDWGSAVMQTIAALLIKLTALAAIIKLLDWLGVPASALLKAGEKIGLFQTPQGDWWAYQEGRDFGKFFMTGFNSRIANLTDSINLQQQPVKVIVHTGDPSTFVEFASKMPLTYKSKFNRDVIRKANIIES